MGNKKKLLTVDIDLSKPITKQLLKQHQPPADILILDALAVVLRQMVIAGRRPRTLQSMETDVLNYVRITGHTSIAEITAESIYLWLDNLGDVKPITRRSRLKTLKSFLGKCNENGWLPVRYWKDINIKVTEEVKESAATKDVELLLSLLDVTDFVQLRDATAILLMYHTGLRIATVGGLETSHIDFTEGCLNLTGSIMKNHKPFKVPLTAQLLQYLSVLLDTNDKIREHTGKKNNFVFISRRGTPVQSSVTHNALQQRLSVYSKQYGIKNINAHALRRAFATNLMKKGAPVALISKALSHSDLAVTTKYLYLSQNEVAESLKDYMDQDN